MAGETTLVLASKVISTVATNLYAGSSLYISLTEIPARRSFKTIEAKLSSFQTVYPFAGRQQGILSLVSLTSTLFSWFKETNNDLGFLLLLNSFILVALTLWTFGFILPINLQLIDGTHALKKGESNVESLLGSWAFRHHVRTIGGLSSVVCMTAYWMKRAAEA